MDLEHLQDIYINNIDRIFTADEFENVARHSNDIQGYSFTNRMLIYMQNRYSTQVRSSNSWISNGYIVKTDATPLGIISPVIETKYFSTDTNEEIGIKELSTTEFAKAVRLGVVRKESNLKSLRCTLVYDVNDISKIDDTDDVVRRRKLKISSLYNLLISIGINVEKADIEKSTFKISENTIIIGNDDLINRIECCVSALVKFLVGISELDISDRVEILAKDYATHAILTYYGIDSHITFNYINELYNNESKSENGIEKLIEILDRIENIINTHIFSNSDEPDYDEDHINHIMSRAEILLSILESNYQSFKFKGA